MTANADNTPDAAGLCPVCGRPANVDAACDHCGWLEWFTWDVQGDDDVLKPFGHLLHAEPVQKFIDAYTPEPDKRLVIDLAKAQYISSAALSKLLTLRKKVLGRKSRISLRSVHPDLWEVFRVTRLDTYFEVEE